MPDVLEQLLQSSNRVPFAVLAHLLVSPQASGRQRGYSPVIVESGPSHTNDYEAEQALRDAQIRRVATRVTLDRSQQASGSGRIVSEPSLWTVSPNAVSTDDERIQPIAQELRRYRSLEENWDSYGGKAPTQLAQQRALEFAIRVDRLWPVVGDRVRPTTISPLPTGGVELEWEGPEAMIAIDVTADGKFGYLVRRGSGRTAQYSHGDDITAGDALSRVLNTLAPRP